MNQVYNDLNTWFIWLEKANHPPSLSNVWVGGWVGEWPQSAAWGEMKRLGIHLVSLDDALLQHLFLLDEHGPHGA